jgi:hypothetical protein
MRRNGVASTSGLIVSVSPSLGVRHGIVCTYYVFVYIYMV